MQTLSALSKCWTNFDRPCLVLLADNRYIQKTPAANPIDGANILPALLNLGSIYDAEARPEKAIIVLERALSISAPTTLRKSPSGYKIAKMLTQAYISANNYEKAEEAANKTVAIAENTYGMDSIETAISLTKLGSLLRKESLYDEGLKVCLRADHIFALAHCDDPEVTFELLNTLTGIYRHLHRYDKVEAAFRQCLGIKPAEREPFRKAVLESHLASYYEEGGDLVKAEECYRKAACIQLSSSFNDRSLSAQIMHLYAGLLKKLDRLPEAEAMLTKAKAIKPREDEEPRELLDPH
ncbi:MAG: tetratricopeptide repeat protein [Cyanobacteria bacterium REEB67]|nr:tetratricopeptide repeat protein [Cyanobacteria bacterium REEB67]